MADLDQFRATTRAWLEANCPAEMRTPMRSEKDACWGGRHFVFQSRAQKQWLDAMGAKGWTVPDWPAEYGGGGLSAAETKVLKEEMAAHRRAQSPLTSFGISMLGPALLKFGSEEQKKHYLPQIARGEIRWCQGYTEPGAGSDLAGLQTKAEDARRPLSSSTGRRCGPATPTRPTGSSAWCGRRPSPSMAGSASCCSTWKAPGFRPSRSC